MITLLRVCLNRLRMLLQAPLSLSPTGEDASSTNSSPPHAMLQSQWLFLPHMAALVCVVVCWGEWQAVSAEDRYLVRKGQPQAEIIIAENPTRTQRLAAHELRQQIEKISGARLPVRTVPSGFLVRVFVGESTHTERLGLSTSELRHGAYRIVSGEDWLALLGDDTDFTPTEPWARNNGDIPRARAEWHEILGAPHGLPHAGLYKNRLRLPGDIGLPDGVEPARNETLELWAFDERGSFNAVCGWLYDLGARWYLPGELGEVLPELDTIPLLRQDKIEQPDFPFRQFNFRLGVIGPEVSLWTMRLGIRNDETLQIAHGMATMTNNDAVFARHPEWFALYGGKRDYDGGSKCQLCYSHQGLFEETVRYARAQFDTYPLQSVSIMPPDGYTAICQCEDCRGQDRPERGSRGALSDHVWDFVNRVAKEVGKTHPDRKILNCAYGVYTLPPENIDKLEPNVLVCIVGGRRPRADQPEEQEALRQLRAAWACKTDNPLLIFENYPFTSRGWYLPAFTVQTLGQSINATKGESQGEDIWLSVARDFAGEGIGFNHFLVYFTARMYWGGPQADIEQLFREYCRLFYGPADQEMLAFFHHCEQNWRGMEQDKELSDHALQLFAAARDRVEPDSLYAQRLDLIDDFLKGLRQKSSLLGQKRGPVPKLRMVWDAKDIVIDGQLDEDYWQNTPVAATGRLRELQTGRPPIYGTSVRAGWQGNSVVLAIRCEESPAEPLNIATDRKGDRALWYGDAVEILIATESHSYYQIAINPAGAVVELDRGVPKERWFDWQSQAEVATHIAPDHWTVEIRLPVTSDENDPLNQIIGRKPTQSLPWHINICRQRIRENGAEYSALSPTGTAGFHVPMKFAHFYSGRSHQFEASPVEDYFQAFRTAERLVTQGKPDEAIAAFAQLAEGKFTDLQKSRLLEQAATVARAQRNHSLAEELAEKIPLEAIRKTVLMENGLARGEASEVVARFGAEPIEQWPFWQQGEAAFARARAFAAGQDPLRAEEDFARALDLTSDPRLQQTIALALGQHRENSLQDDARALTAYRQVFAERTQLSGATEMTAAQSAARILKRQGEYAEALKLLERIDTDKIGGTWRHSTLIARGEILQAAQQLQAARALFEAVLQEDNVASRHREAAESYLQQLRDNSPEE